MKFSIVIIPDSQVTIQNWPQDADAYGDWIKANTTRLNICAVIGVGDITEWPRSKDWADAADAYARMGDVVKAPADGNHDFDHWDTQTDEISQGGGDRSLSNYNRAFPLSSLNGVVASFPEGRSGNMAQEFTAAGIKFLIVSVNYVPKPEELAWTHRTIVAFPNHKIIINTHDYMNQTERSESGNRIWNIIRRSPNVVMTFNGHYWPAAGHRVDDADDGHAIYQFMVDYQNYNSREPNSYIQILTFDASDLSIAVQTYSPAFGKYMRGDENEFELFGVPFLADATEEPPVARPDEAITRRVADRIDAVVRKWYPKSAEISRGSGYRATEADGGTWSQHNGQFYQNSPSAAIDYSENDAVTGSYQAGVKNAATAAMRDFAKWWFDEFGDLTVQEFHTTPYSDDIGFNISNQVKNTGDVPDHANHIHLATSDALLAAIEARATAKWGSNPPVPTPVPTPTPPGPPTALSEGLDYAFSRPSVSQMKDLGYKFVCRYLSQVNNLTQPKILTREEAQALSDAGIQVVSNFEWYPERCTEGFAAGVADATIALQQATAAGMPAGRPIYFSVDKDVLVSAVVDYFRGLASVMPVDQIGVYGSYGICKDLDFANLAEWFWQTKAWSGGQWYALSHIEQYELDVRVAGGDVDRNRGMKADVGGWFVGVGPVPHPTPIPVPVPDPQPIPGEEIMDVTKILVPSAATADVPDRTLDQVLGDLWKDVHWTLPDIIEDIDEIKTRLDELEGGSESDEPDDSEDEPDEEYDEDEEEDEEEDTEEQNDSGASPARIASRQAARRVNRQARRSKEAPSGLVGMFNYPEPTPVKTSALDPSKYAKAIVSSLGAAFATYTAFKSGGMTAEEWQQVLVAGVGMLGLTWAVPNKTDKDV